MKTRSKTSLFYLLLLLISCKADLNKGKLLPNKDARSVYETLYAKNNYDGQRIAIEGFISIQNWRQRGDEIFCELVDEKGEHLLFINVKNDKKNSINLGKTGDSEKKNNLHYEDYDEKKSFSIGNDGKHIPLTNKIKLSFDIVYSKNKETGKYVMVEVPEKTNGLPFEKYIKKGDKQFLFQTENIRIDESK